MHQCSDITSVLNLLSLLPYELSRNIHIWHSEEPNDLMKKTGEFWLLPCICSSFLNYLYICVIIKIWVRKNILSFLRLLLDTPIPELLLSIVSFFCFTIMITFYSYRRTQCILLYKIIKLQFPYKQDHFWLYRS